uniref:PLAT domain-containing protein n=1 Tax=Oryzias latipes TaxID=8090 RepID=A0A3P9MN30_ORYLA
MADYKVTLYTDDSLAAGTLNHVFIKLVGTQGESERKWLIGLKGAKAFMRGAVSSFTVSAPTSLGQLVLVEVDKKAFLGFLEDSWFLAKVEVKSPNGDTFTFPVHRWISDKSVHRFREATGLWTLFMYTTYYSVHKKIRGTLFPPCAYLQCQISTFIPSCSSEGL